MLLVVFISPVLSPAVTGMLALILVAINIVTMIPLLVLLACPQLSLSLVSMAFRLLWTVISKAFSIPTIFTMHPCLFETDEVDFQVEKRDGVLGSHSLSPRRPGWIRMCAFILSMLWCGEDLGSHFLLTYASCHIGVHAIVFSLSAALCCAVSSGNANPSNVTQSERFRVSGSSWHANEDEMYSRSFYLGQFVGGVFCLACGVQRMTCLEVLLLLTFSICSDGCVQHYLTLQAQKCQVDLLDGFEVEVVQGVLIFLDLLACVSVCTKAVYREQYLALVLTYCNGFIALMKLLICVWQQVQTGLDDLADFRRATTRELDEHDDVCAVCLSSMSAGRFTPCGHLFHGKCLKQVLAVRPQCPMCKRQIDRSSRETGS